jgi:hypothetical protein
LFFKFDYVFDFLPFFEHCPADDARVFSEERVETFERAWGRVEVHEPVAVCARWN